MRKQVPLQCLRDRSLLGTFGARDRYRHTIGCRLEQTDVLLLEAPRRERPHVQYTDHATPIEQRNTE
jgi:hypothetical protein